MLVYKATNRINGKVYVGATTNTLEARFRQHLKSSRRSSASYFQKAIRLYGIQSFDIRVIDVAGNTVALSQKENYWIKRLRTLAPHGYNLASGGDELWKHSPESNEKNRLAHLGKKATPMTLAKMSAAHRGRKHSDETKEKMLTDGRRGRKPTAEAIEKNRQAHLGRKTSIETKRKISASLKGHPSWNHHRLIPRDADGSFKKALVQ